MNHKTLIRDLASTALKWGFFNDVFLHLDSTMFTLSLYSFCRNFHGYFERSKRARVCLGFEGKLKNFFRYQLVSRY